MYSYSEKNDYPTCKSDCTAKYFYLKKILFTTDCAFKGGFYAGKSKHLEAFTPPENNRIEKCEDVYNYGAISLQTASVPIITIHFNFCVHQNGPPPDSVR